MISRRKNFYPVSASLGQYLYHFGRYSEIPLVYDDLLRFSGSIPYEDPSGKETLWQTVMYPHEDMLELRPQLTQIYAELKIGGETTHHEHLIVDRIDFGEFGNSRPFRIRITNQYNDNSDYYYVKNADASRIYGLELEHILSPNRINYLCRGNTLIEEHIAGIPGDIFIERHLQGYPELNPVRVAKELVKFNERCFVRLLGDMRAYNFVFVITPDFETAQVRLRAMDFDQQSFNGRKRFYLPQFFKENLPLVNYCNEHMHEQTALQYQREEQTLIVHRADLAKVRLGMLLDEMRADRLAPDEKVHALREELAEHFQNKRYLKCETMGALVRENLATIRDMIVQ